MYIVDKKLANSLYATLCHCYRDVSFSLKDRMGYFFVQMSENEFKDALGRAICEYRENKEEAKILEQTYDDETGSFQCFSKKYVTEKEANNVRFMSLLVGDAEYEIISVNLKYDIMDQDVPVGSVFSVRADIANIVEDTLIRCLYDYSRSGNMFKVLANEHSFSKIVRHACAVMGYVRENDPDELIIDDEDYVESADVGAYFHAL